MPSDSPLRRHKKSIYMVVWIAGVLLCMVCAIGLAWLLLPVDRIAERQAREWLRTQGVEADFKVTELTAYRLALEDLRLGGIAAGHVVAGYSLDNLMQKRVRQLEIRDLHVTATQDESGVWRIAGLEPLLPAGDAAEEGFTLPALPFDRLAIPDARITLHPHDGEAYTATARLELHGDYTGALTVSEADLPIGESGSVLVTDLTLTREEAGAPFAVTLGNLAHLTGGKAYFTPLRATGEIALARDNRDIAGRMDISDLRGLWTLRLNGSAALDAGSWKLAFEQPDMTFETGIIQPDMLFPVLRGSVSQMGGVLSLKGEVTKAGADADITSGGELRARNLSGVIADVPVNGVSGTVALSSLWPPATRGKQKLAVEEILLGLPLKKGALSFSLAQDGTANFAPSTWQWAGGQLQTSGATINIHALRLPDMTLSAKGLALEELLSSLLQKGISATGRLDGTLPVSFTKDGDAMIKGGILSAQGGGVVRYSPDAESPLQMGHSFQTDLLLSALSNFHYDTLNMAIDSADAGAMTVVLHVKGRNPELYGGQLIELNINLSGNLMDIVQSGMNIYTLPERLQEQWMQ